MATTHDPGPILPLPPLGQRGDASSTSAPLNEAAGSIGGTMTNSAPSTSVGGNHQQQGSNESQSLNAIAAESPLATSLTTQQNPAAINLNLFVSGLHPDVADQHLRSLFAPFGSIVSATVMRTTTSGASRRFGFVLFEHKADAQRAMRELNGKQVNLNPTRAVASPTGSSIPITGVDSAIMPVMPDSTYAPTDGAAAGDSGGAGADGSTGALPCLLHIEESEHRSSGVAIESKVVHVRLLPGQATRDDILELFQNFGTVRGLNIEPIRANGAARRTAKKRLQQAAAVGGSSLPQQQGGASPGEPGATSVGDSVPNDSLSGSIAGPAATHYRAAVEFATVDQARAAVESLHESRPWSYCTCSLMAKFADTAEISEYKKNHRKVRKQIIEKQREEAQRGRTTAEGVAQAVLSTSSAETTPRQGPTSAPPPAGNFMLGNRTLSQNVMPTNVSNNNTTSGAAAAGLGFQTSGQLGAHHNAPPVVVGVRGPMPIAENGAPAGIPIPPGQVIQYSGTLVSNGNGTFSILHPVSISFITGAHDNPANGQQPHQHPGEQQFATQAQMMAAAQQAQWQAAAAHAAAALAAQGGGPPPQFAQFVPHQFSGQAMAFNGQQPHLVPMNLATSLGNNVWVYHDPARSLAMSVPQSVNSSQHQHGAAAPTGHQQRAVAAASTSGPLPPAYQPQTIPSEPIAPPWVSHPGSIGGSSLPSLLET